MKAPNKFTWDGGINCHPMLTRTSAKQLCTAVTAWMSGLYACVANILKFDAIALCSLFCSFIISVVLRFTFFIPFLPLFSVIFHFVFVFVCLFVCLFFFLAQNH